MRETVLSRLLGPLYDAASDEALWIPFLESLARETGGHAAAVVMHGPFPERRIVLNAGVSPELANLYRDHYHRLDVWAIRGLAQTAAGWVGASEELCRWGEFRNHEFYNDFTLPVANIAHGMFALLSKEETRFTNLSVYRTPQQGPFGEEETAVLKFLSPHLRRAFRLHFQLCSLRDRNRSLDVLIDSLSQGIILLGPSGRVLHMNRVARQLCEARDGLLAAGSGLAAENPMESATLQAMISQAISTSLGGGSSAGGGMQVLRKSGASLNMVVSPVRGLATDFLDNVCAVVYVTDPSLRIRPRNELLEAVYGLTPAECRIALLLADGVATSTIREMIGITGNTLKTHLARIYRKTNTARQTQLVKLISLIGMAGPLGPA